MEHVGAGDVERSAHPVEADLQVRLQGGLKTGGYIGGSEAM